MEGNICKEEAAFGTWWWCQEVLEVARAVSPSSAGPPRSLRCYPWIRGAWSLGWWGGWWQLLCRNDILGQRQIWLQLSGEHFPGVERWHSQGLAQPGGDLGCQKNAASNWYNQWAWALMDKTWGCLRLNSGTCRQGFSLVVPSVLLPLRWMV